MSVANIELFFKKIQTASKFKQIFCRQIWYSSIILLILQNLMFNV